MKTIQALCGLFLTSLIGCTQTPPPEQPFFGDEQTLRALDPYNPVYRLDGEGRVIDLILQGKHVLAPVMVEVGKLTELHRLNLVGASLTDESLSHLRSLKKLKVLRMGSTPISDKGLAHLESLQDLRQIYFPFTNVTPDGAKNLQTALPLAKIHSK